MAKEKVVEKIIDVKKQKLEALEAARAQIDKEFGKGIDDNIFRFHISNYR